MQYRSTAYLLLSLAFSVVLSKEIVPFGEEFLLVSAFLIFFTVAYNNISTIISASLQDRSEQIFQSLSNLLSLKRSNLDELGVVFNHLKNSDSSFVNVCGLLFNVREHAFKQWNADSKGFILGTVHADLSLALALEVAVNRRFNLMKYDNALLLGSEQ